MEGLLQPTHLFLILLAGMFLFPVFIVVTVLILVRRGKSPDLANGFGKR
jgi:hypothetical protein